MAHTIVFLAAAQTALDRLQKIPTAFYVKVGLAILAIILVVFIARKVMQTNKFMMGIVGFVFCGLMFFNWIYNRNEPAFLTPLINKIAPFFPSAGSYQVTQTKTPDETTKDKAKH